MARKEDEDTILNNIIKFAKKEKTLNEAVENEILFYFGDKGSKILEVLNNNKLHRLRISRKIDLWQVEGKDKDYLIIGDNYCECYDFQMRVLIKKERQYCYHLIAKKLGGALKLYDTHTLTDEEYKQLIKKRITKISKWLAEDT